MSEEVEHGTEEEEEFFISKSTYKQQQPGLG
jgi:hypothetical protein